MNNFGEEDRTSAKKRRQESYRKDLELQMLESTAARKREKFQGMNVNASGWLDPEKGPERLKPLGGSGFMTDRTTRNPKVVPYHTLFNYDKLNEREVVMPTQRSVTAIGWSHQPMTISDNRVNVPAFSRVRLEGLNLDPPAGLTIQPLTLATTNGAHPHHMSSVHDAYNFYATRDLDRPAAYHGSIIQPLTIPYVDNRPIIMPGGCNHSVERMPRYNPFRNHDDSVSREIKTLLGLSQVENERLKAQRIKDQDEHQRRMRRELEEERRKLMQQELEARRRIEAMRREAEERQREWERRMREAERLRNLKTVEVKKEVVIVRPSSSTLLADMEDTRRRLADERRKIEELLRAQLRAPDYTEVKVLRRPPPPPTPVDFDKANQYTLNEFSHLKNQDAQTRLAFRNRYPDHPETNKRLERQQEALLRQQEDYLNSLGTRHVPAAPPGMVLVQKGFRRPSWLEKAPTPFPHRLRQRDRLYTTQSLDGDLDRLYRKNERRERAIDSIRVTENDADAVVDNFDRFKLGYNRPSSTDTLADDTWLRPTSVTTF